jgi:hypothetical protein
MTSSNRKPAPPKKPGDLDAPYLPGDAIPAPEATEKTGDSAWALWNEIANQHEVRFAETKPATAPMSLNTEERGWARTAPVELQPREGGTAGRAGPVTIDAAMVLARRNNRVCPRPQRWAEFSMLLADSRADLRTPQPPAPATGAAWTQTSSLAKRLCFREQIEWAQRHGALDKAMAFIVALPESDWLHMGDD